MGDFKVTEDVEGSTTNRSTHSTIIIKIELIAKVVWVLENSIPSNSGLIYAARLNEDLKALRHPKAMAGLPHIALKGAENRKLIPYDILVVND
jgi:hypothetical protein